MNKKAADLVKYVKGLVGCGYVYGVNGKIVTEELIQTKARQYPAMYTENYKRLCRSWIGKMAYDCSAIIDTFVGVDKSADGWLAEAKEKGPISTMPNVPGTLVHSSKHIGVYIGNGEVVEARGVIYGVVITKLAGRAWRNWSKCPLIDYSVAVEAGPDVSALWIRKGEKGDRVIWLQKQLNRFGYGLKVDGDFGTKTDSALRDFQNKHHLKADGLCGSATKAKLLAA